MKEDKPEFVGSNNKGFLYAYTSSLFGNSLGVVFLSCPELFY